MINFKEIEEKWKNIWEETKLYATDTKSTKEKTYFLVEFPYPSGAGLHVGHVRSYTAMDILARKKRREGHEVLFPIGWDAFGLPAENYAIKTGIHPKITTQENIATFRRQLKACGFSFDWEREVDTTDPEYYKWTQWIFLKMYEQGLAYKKEMPVNWCPKDKCVLANEEVVDGACERCGTKVEKKNKQQWMLAITKYAERLDKDLDETDYLEKIKIQQRNWIGLSTGSEITFTLTGKDTSNAFTIFTTRADTLMGCTYCVLAPEHPLVKECLISGAITNKDEVTSYIHEATQKLDIERGAEGKEKTGVKLIGLSAVHPVTHEELPVFIADYVLPHYGTGAIMAVPAHDIRDKEFADAKSLPVVYVIDEHGMLINSGDFNGLTTELAKKKITEAVGGTLVTKSKLRDWVFARQRYWGEPIPLVYDAQGNMYPVSETELPIVLPQVDKYEPTDSGESPLSSVREWVEVRGYINERGSFLQKEDGDIFYRETDTMPQWAGSSWYFMRYIDPKNTNSLGDSDLLKNWLPVSWYNGGMEHTTLHLLYSRFWYKFLYDIGVVPSKEPYIKRTSQGMILGEGGVKMSKSLGNVVNPDEIIDSFGADVLRMYEMFMGPFDQQIAWDKKAIVGVERFIDRVIKLHHKVQDTGESSTSIHQTIKKVSEGIEAMQFNTCISQLMICLNDLEKGESVSKEDYTLFLQILAPFAPFITEELWSNLKSGNDSIHRSPWPNYDETKLIERTVTIAISFNGKLRGTLNVPTDSEEALVIEKAQGEDFYRRNLGEATPKRVIFVKNKMLNIVI